MVTAFFTLGLADSAVWPLTPEMVAALPEAGVPEWRLDLRRGAEPVISVDAQSVFTLSSEGVPPSVAVRLGLLDWSPLGITNGAYRARLVMFNADGQDGLAVGESHGFDDIVYCREA